MEYDFPSQSGGCNVTLPGPSLQSLCSTAESIVFMTALDAALRNDPTISGSCERVKPIDDPLHKYDFIVVGGGAGGAATAGRLAEVCDWKVLLIEAGPDESVIGQIPRYAPKLVGSEIDWNYYSTNESFACLSKGGSCYLSAARCLGGNTAHNDMMYMRGFPKDYDNWAALGNDGWAWDEVFPYFLKQENNANTDRVGHKYHSTEGPLFVESSPYNSDLVEVIVKGAVEQGFGFSEDLNGEVFSGVTLLQSMQKNGLRCSSSKAYLWPQRYNKNLHISLNSFVTKVIIGNGTAVGVEYTKNGESRRVYAKKEVILSAGVIRSPQLLLLSGIGPKEELESKGIKVVANLPGVGKNLHDHAVFIIPSTMNQTDHHGKNLIIAEQYVRGQFGNSSTTSGLFVFGAGHTNETTPDYPNFRIGIQGPTADCAPDDVNALKNEGRQDFVIWVTLARPKSRGRLSLASRDPFDHPVAWVNYLSNPNDMKVLLDGIEQGLNLFEAEVLKPYDIRLAVKPTEACSQYTIPSREYWACAVQQDVEPELHLVGTNKMGPASDPMAVVDSKLRVHGIKNLRVVDASIMPQVTSANTAAPTMMIGERAADFLKETWLRPNDKIRSPWGKSQSREK